MFKFQNGITHRQHDYETKYFAMITKAFPEHWTSWRSYEATRSIYNIATKYGFFDELKAEISKRRDFLNPELSTETALQILKELFTMVAQNLSNGPCSVELKAVFIELALMCVLSPVLRNNTGTI